MKKLLNGAQRWVLILIVGVLLFPSAALAQANFTSSSDQLAQTIILLQKQVALLQEQLAELLKANKDDKKPVYYATLADGKERDCFVIIITEKDGTAAIDEKINLQVTNGKTRTAKVTTNDEGKIKYCRPATKFKVKSKLLKQDTVLQVNSQVSPETTEPSVEKTPGSFIRSDGWVCYPVKKPVYGRLYDCAAGG